MIDIHAHLLPALDHGPKTFEDAILTALALTREGVTEAVATPFYAQAYGAIAAEEVEARVMALQRVLDKVNIPLKVRVGHEAALTEKVEPLLSKGTLATLNDGPYVLLAPPDERSPADMVPIISRLRRKGFVPILSHVERYAQRHPVETLVPLVEAGAMLQVIAASLTPQAPEAYRSVAQEMLERDMVHALASGTCGVHRRPLRFTAGVRAAQMIVGPQRIWELAVDIPKAIVSGDPIDIPPVRARRRGGESYESYE